MSQWEHERRQISGRGGPRHPTRLSVLSPALSEPGRCPPGLHNLLPAPPPTLGPPPQGTSGCVGLGAPGRGGRTPACACLSPGLGFLIYKMGIDAVPSSKHFRQMINSLAHRPGFRKRSVLRVLFLAGWFRELTRALAAWRQRPGPGLLTSVAVPGKGDPRPQGILATRAPSCFLDPAVRGQAARSGPGWGGILAHPRPPGTG